MFPFIFKAKASHVVKILELTAYFVLHDIISTNTE